MMEDFSQFWLGHIDTALSLSLVPHAFAKYSYVSYKTSLLVIIFARVKLTEFHMSKSLNYGVAFLIIAHVPSHTCIYGSYRFFVYVFSPQKYAPQLRNDSIRGIKKL